MIRPLSRLFLLALACLGCLSPAFGQTPRVLLRFDNSTADASGAGVITTITPNWAPSYVADRNGVANGAINFTAAHSIQLLAASLPGNSAQALGMRNAAGAGQAFTVAAWISVPSTANSNAVFGLLGSGAGTLHGGLSGNRGQLAFENANDATGATVAVSTNTWFHLALVFDGTSQRVYVNGIPEIVRTASPNTINAGDVHVGNWGTANSATNDFIGSMDDFAVYNSALTGGQISALFNGVNPAALPATYSGPKLPGVFGTAGSWGVREVRGYPAIGYGTLVNADRMIRAYPGAPGGTVAEYLAPVLNHIDPEGAGTLGNFTGESPFGTNTAAGDDNILVIARCAVRIPAAGNYTFGFRSDDGSRLRVLGQQFASSTRLQAANVANPAHQGDAIVFPNGNGDTHTLGVVNFTAAGDYNLEYVWWEGSGGSSFEVFAAPGSLTAFGSAFRLIGDTAGGGLEIVRDTEIVPAFTVAGGGSLFIHAGVPANFTLAWAVANPATTLSIDQGIGAVAASGSQVLAAPGSTTTYTMTATTPIAGGSDVAAKSVTVYVNSAPVIQSLTASDTTVTASAAVTLTWAVLGATTLTLQPGNINVTGQTSRVVNPTADTTYTLHAVNASGTTQQTVFIDVGAAPAINSFTSSDATPLYNAQVTLSWNVTAADTVSINQGVGAISGAAGSTDVQPVQTTTYTLTATNVYGPAAATATVTIATPIGVSAAGFTVTRYNSTLAFPYAGMGYLQSADALIAGTNLAAQTTVTAVTSINYTDGADGDFTAGNVAFPTLAGGQGGDHFAIKASGTLVVNTPGEYVFILNSDDGGRLRIDGQDVIVDDATHPPSANLGKVTITKPSVTIEIVYYDWTGGAEVELAWVRTNLAWTLLGTAAPAAPIVHGQVRIAEFMAENDNGLLDEDGASSDWIEIWNSTNATVNLGTFYLTDSAGTPNKWALPAWTLAPNGSAIVFASGKNRRPAQAVAGQDNPGTLAQPHLHTDFTLPTAGGYLALTKDDGLGGFTTLTVFNPYPAQREDVSYGTSDAESYLGFMETPTPGFANGVVVTDFVSDTVFSQQRGRYTTPFSLTLSTATPGSTIRYTLDGSEPTLNSGTIYSAPISISATKVVRAAAFKQGWRGSNVDTKTYLFLDDVVTQNAAHAVALGFPSAPSGAGQTYRYGMALANVTAGGGTLQGLKDALAAAPSVIISTSAGNLFNPSTTGGVGGIYANPGQRGLEWERRTSMEMINAAGTSEFQIDCGIRIRGGFSRSTANPKHAFHLYFRGSLYDGDLKYRLFGASGAAAFDQIDIRCEQNYSWSFQNDARNALMREELSRATQRDMGQPYARDSYFHLYINGVYWGIYNWEERTEAAYGGTYLGGVKETTDVVKSAGSTNSYSTEMTDGNFAAWQSLYTQCIALKNDAASEASRTARYLQMQGKNADGSSNPAYPVLLDVDNLIDYQLTVFYAGSWDSPVIGSGSNNWFGVRDRAGARGFTFFAHDQEHGMDAGNTGYNRVGPWGASGANNWGQTMYNQRETFTNGHYNKSNPHYVHELLCYSAEYRQRFADRVQRHFFNNGPLTTAAATARANALATQIGSMIHAEAARWGSTGLHRNTWLAAKTDVIDFITTGLDDTPPGGTSWTNPYPGGRGPLVIEQLRGYQDPVAFAKPLFPAATNSAPVFSGAFGGPVADPHSFTIANPNPAGAIYYTVNAADPRAIGGGIAPGALTGGSPVPVTLTSTATVRARIFNVGTGEWSPLTETQYLVGGLASAANLAISKIHYNPAGAGNLTQFVELMNISGVSIDMTNVRFLLGIQFTFPAGYLLAPGARVLIVRDQVAFTAAYPSVPLAQIVGVFAGGTTLDTGGEALQLVDAVGTEIRGFTYDNNAPWPESPDNGGPALVLIKPETNPAHGTPANWRASYATGGGPGVTDAIAFAAWHANLGLTGGLGGDDDHDGSTNLAEYYRGSSPLDPAAAGLPVQSVQPVDVGGIVSDYLTLTFTRMLGRDDASASVQYTADITAAWSPAILVGTPAYNGDGTETLTYRYPVPVPAPPVNGTRQFLRLRITQP